jgi:hypothetical protein
MEISPRNIYLVPSPSMPSRPSSGVNLGGFQQFHQPGYKNQPAGGPEFLLCSIPSVIPHGKHLFRDRPIHHHPTLPPDETPSLTQPTASTKRAKFAPTPPTLTASHTQTGGELQAARTSRPDPTSITPDWLAHLQGAHLLKHPTTMIPHQEPESPTDNSTFPETTTPYAARPPWLPR